jgi:succinyl-CoA synthetase beta subunit
MFITPESETSEFYVSVLLNRATGRNMIMFYEGMDIEVAEHTIFNFHRRN